MKLLTIIYDSGIEASMAELLQGLQVPGLTLFRDVHGRGGRGPKENTPIFPGTNNVVLAALPDEEVERVRRAIRSLQAGYRLKPGVTILCQEVEALP